MRRSFTRKAIAAACAALLALCALAGCAGGQEEAGSQGQGQKHEPLTVCNLNGLFHDEFIEEFQKLEIDGGSTDIPVATSAAFTGATMGEDNVLSFNTENEAPYGGAAFIAQRGRKMADGTYKRYFRAVLYPMLKGRRNNGAATTKGSSISFANDSAHFTGKACAKGDYIVQQDFDTMAAAEAWLETVMPMAKA